jgi:molybdopterin-guanine dinucleotide biosynthesis protein A
MPLVTGDSLRQLLNQMKNEESFICYRTERPQPLFALADKSILPVIRNLLAEGKRSLYSLLDSLDYRTIPLSDAELAMDIDTPEELADLKKAIARQSD